MPTANQPRQRETRVFISTTFRDMQEEREELVKQTFPQLRRLCESRGVTGARWISAGESSTKPKPKEGPAPLPGGD